MNDRRLLMALALVMVITLVPTFFMRKRLPPPSGQVVADSQTQVQPGAAPAAAPPAGAPGAVVLPGVPPPPAPVPDSGADADTIVVRSGLYRYGISTRGGQIVSSRFLHYVSLAPGDHRDTLELLGPGQGLFGNTLITGSDTLRLDQVTFTASADSLDATHAPAVLTLHGQSGGYAIDLRYEFSPQDYHITTSGRVTGLGPAGGTLLIGLGDGFRATEADARDNTSQSGIVTKLDKTRLTLVGKLKPRELTPMSGPFEWVAVKSKYFVAGLFAYDSSATGSVKGRIGGVEAYAPDTASHPTHAQVAASLSVTADGAFAWRAYVGPMEYDRLHQMGRDFDDVNPYGWAWLHPVIRPIAVWIRAIFVWMHLAMGLGYGLVIVLFGLLVRVLLWPLNRAALRSMARMQTVQPQIAALQERYKDDPQQLQQETFKLYKEHHVNPFGGCWPMLLPYPLLVAVFFVLNSTIEVRGVTFLWLPDLARADPLYIIPVLMAVSMYGVSKIGQMGLPPNPQTKMMTWMMPVMMLVLFSRFASGLNLYYTIQNLASIPQQWLVVRERTQAGSKAPVAVIRKKPGRS